MRRDVSVSLEKLADFLARRGQAGDGEAALGHYQRSLEVRERLLVANPESASLVRDVVVSHFKLAQFGQRAATRRWRCGTSANVTGCCTLESPLASPSTRPSWASTNNCTRPSVAAREGHPRQATATCCAENRSVNHA